MGFVMKLRGAWKWNASAGFFEECRIMGRILELIRGEIDQGRSGGKFWEEGRSQECWDWAHGARMDDM